MQSEAAAPPGLRAWLGLAVLTLPVALLGIDMSVLHLAVPHLSADLRPSAAQLLWIVDIYGFLIVGFLITMGTLGDRIGRRRLLLIGAGAFGLASMLAAFSASAEMLIVARALLGAAGATLMPSTLSLLRVTFEDRRHRSVAVGIWTAGFMGGSALGPVVGGAMLERFWWGSVFLLGVPVMALLLALGPALLPEYRNAEPEPLDLASAVLLLVAMLAVVYGVKEVAAHGADPAPLLAIVGAAVAGLVFLRRQRRLRNPLLDLGLFANRAFSASLGIVLLSALTFAGAQFLIAQYLQTVLGLSPLRAGLWTLPAMVANVATILVSPLLVRRIALPYLVTGSLAVMAGGLTLLGLVGPGDDLPTVVTAFALLAGGLGPIMALSTHLATSTAPREKTGTAAGVMETTSELGIALGIAAVGSLGAAVYRREIVDAIPRGVPDAAADAAQDTIGAAVEASGGLPPHLGEALLDVAEHAFARGMQVSATAGATTLLVMAGVALLVLRRADTTSI
jgi:MFS transporter, DHA2 family, multidrug resistance protein